MKGYTIHLLFHLLALLVGGACGAAAGFWLFGGNDTALWVFVAALVAGLALLVSQLAFITGGDRSSSRAEVSARSTPRIDIHHAPEQGHLDRTRVHGQPGPAGSVHTGTRPDLEPVNDETAVSEERTSVTGTTEQTGRADPTTKRW